MGVTIYYMDGSPPCHRVFFLAKILKIDLTLKPLDYMKQEHLAPDFLKLNPQHTVPTLMDGDLVLWESRAILRYLVNKYSAGSPLYPQDPVSRAKVDQQLDYDFGLYEKFADYYYPQFEGGEAPSEEKLKKILTTVGYLNTSLEGRKYVAGDHFTIADCALLSSLAIFEAVDALDLKSYPNIAKWFELVKASVPEYRESLEKNIEVFKTLVAEFQKK